MIRGRQGIVVLGAMSALVGCNIGDRIAGIDGSGAPAPSAIRGPIEGFGSIVVGGVHYDVAGAQIDVNGAPASEADLALGQLVTILGTRDANASEGVADSVVFEANVRGPVEMLDPGLGTLRVLGQAVTTDAATVLDFGSDPAALDSLSVGEAVEVSGFVGAGGLINATRVERVDGSAELRVIGVVSNLASAFFSFTINGLTVNYSDVQMLEGFPTGAPQNGDTVLVEGTDLSALGELDADSVELFAESFERAEGEEAEVEGLITRFASPTDFDVSGLAVTTTAATDYEGGDESDLQLNVKVQVEGTVDSTGTIVASKIEVKDGGDVVGDR